MLGDYTELLLQAGSPYYFPLNFNYLSPTTYSIKFLTLPLHANFNSHYQQGETALSEILESTSVQ